MITHFLNRSKLFSTAVIVLVFSVMLSACSTVQIGHDFDVQLFDSKVQPGKTTKAQVRDWLGAPGGTGMSLAKDGELSEEWMYFYGAGVLPKMQNTTIKILQIRFSKNGVINSYNWSNGK